MSYYYQCSGGFDLLYPVPAGTLRDIDRSTPEGQVVLWPHQVLIDPDAEDAEQQRADLEPGQQEVDPWDLAPFVMRASTGVPQVHDLGELVPIEARRIEWRTVYGSTHPIGWKPGDLVDELDRILKVLFDSRPEGNLPCGAECRFDLAGERHDDLLTFTPHIAPRDNGSMVHIRRAPDLSAWEQVTSDSLDREVG